MNGAKQWATNDAIEWLESAEGEEWSQSRHQQVYLLVTVKLSDAEEDAFGDMSHILWYASPR